MAELAGGEMLMLFLFMDLPSDQSEKVASFGQADEACPTFAGAP